MAYRASLSFLRRLLKDMNISSFVLHNPDERIPADIDLRLRASLFDLENYSGFLHNSMEQAKDRTLYRFVDEYGCTYIFLRLPEPDSYFFIGPYLLSLPSEVFISSMLSDLPLPADHAKWLSLYYASLPLIEDENLLIKAVSKGKLQQVTATASTIFNNGAEPRLADSLRDQKNNLVILKTLLRKAAEMGGVHPWHIHQLSSHYADLIENCRTMKQGLSIQEEMIRSYCQLVKQHSLSKYSYYVGRAITLVQYDLTADLRLKTIAGQLNVNSSYLSRLFHQEYGCTLTQFINRQRVEHATPITLQNEISPTPSSTLCSTIDRPKTG